jgi:hypothetical protein
VKGHDFTVCGKTLLRGAFQQGMTLQLAKNPLEMRFVTGHDFSRAGKAAE